MFSFFPVCTRKTALAQTQTAVSRVLPQDVENRLAPEFSEGWIWDRLRMPGHRGTSCHTSEQNRTHLMFSSRIRLRLRSVQFILIIAAISTTTTYYRYYRYCRYYCYNHYTPSKTRCYSTLLLGLHSDAGSTHTHRVDAVRRWSMYVRCVTLAPPTEAAQQDV